MPITIYKNLPTNNSNYLSSIKHNYINVNENNFFKNDDNDDDHYIQKSHKHLNEIHSYCDPLQIDNNPIEMNCLPSSLKFDKNSMSISINKPIYPLINVNDDGDVVDKLLCTRKFKQFNERIDDIDCQHSTLTIDDRSIHNKQMDKRSFIKYQRDFMRLYNHISDGNGKYTTTNKLKKDTMRPAVVLRNPRGNQIRTYTTDALYAALMDVKDGESIYR